MKNILTKLKINYFTYFYFLIAFLCGYFKNSLMLFLIVIVHELGHILVIRLFKYEIVFVTLYPFGGITKINKPVNSAINKELIIAIFGVVSQIILLILINDTLFCYYNLTIMLFNLLPIYPLDGNKLVNLFLEKFLPFEKALKYTNIISLITLVIFIFFNVFGHYRNYLICSFLIVQLFLNLKNQKYFINRFYLERYLYSFPYHKIENNQSLDIHLLKKETLHFFKKQDCYLHEKQLLKQIFKK